MYCFMFKRRPEFAILRIVFLLFCLIVVGFTSAHQRVYTRNWNQTIPVTIFPINGDGHLQTVRYIESLSDQDFSVITRWGEREAQRHELTLKTPFKVSLGDAVDRQPPVFPSNANTIEVLLWGLRFRYWAWRHTPDDKAGLTRVRMFVVYQQGDDGLPLRHSLGMQKGLIGLVYAFSVDRQTAQNNIVIAHELLHTVGATDKYGATGNPRQPVGLANPQRQPMYPQRYAEIMAGRIPTSDYASYMAESLRSVIVNDYTATEINWKR